MTNGSDFAQFASVPAELRLADIALADAARRHFQHPVEAHLRAQPQALLDLDPRLQVAQAT
jgi:hypothetical protein